VNRFRLTLNPSLYAPSYAVLLGAFLASAVANTYVTSPVVAAADRIAIGAVIALCGVHFVMYRESHRELLAERLRLKQYSVRVVTIVGCMAVLTGIAIATLGYVALKSL
jgi:hypothetical protein